MNDNETTPYSFGTIKGTNISFEEIEPYNDDEETGKWKVFHLGREAGVLIATGHKMMPSEFEVTSPKVLGDALLDFKFYLNNIAKEKNYSLEFEDNKVLFDDEEIAEFKQDGSIVITDEDLLGYFISDMTSYAEWTDEPENKDVIFILNNGEIYDSFVKDDFKGNESIIEIFTKKENWVLEAYAKENLHEDNDYIDFLSKMNFKLIENDKIEIDDTFLNKIITDFDTKKSLNREEKHDNILESQKETTYINIIDREASRGDSLFLYAQFLKDDFKGNETILEMFKGTDLEKVFSDKLKDENDYISCLKIIDMEVMEGKNKIDTLSEYDEISLIKKADFGLIEENAQIDESKKVRRQR